jgi:Zn-dependent protease
MERAAAAARRFETAGELTRAYQQWMSVLPLLPPESKQAEWIRGHLRELEAAAINARPPAQHRTQGRWARWLAPLAPAAVILAKAKTFLLLIFKLKFLFSFASFIGLYWAMWGPKYGIGFAVLILIHELGHYVDIRRRGLPADMPFFLPGLGAYVRWQAIGVSPETRAAVSLAGPLAGFGSAAACALIAIKTGDQVWFALARTGAWLNALNLIPIWVLDGAGAMIPLSLMEKFLVMAVSAGLGYATHEAVFYFVAGGALFKAMAGMLAQRRATRASAVGVDGSGRPLQIDARYSIPLEEPPRGSPLITAYFLAVLTALATLVYLLPRHGIGTP